MSTKTLRGFQTTAVNSGLTLFTHAKTQLDTAGSDAQSRLETINHNGYLLLEAPTGSGKTLIAGNIVERFSSIEEVVWFWFAPFSGVVGQTIDSLRGDFSGLHLRELHVDRTIAGSRRGDVFVTTWQTVATRVAGRRNVRKRSESMPSVDELVRGLRALGLRIGVVVDEAHHGFHGETQAAKFFTEILSPDYTILVTATPDDADIEDFKQRLGVPELHRTRISRGDVVDSGLIKESVKCIAYFTDEEKRSLVDFEMTALRDATALHRRIKQTLTDSGISLAPLMLIQVDSSKDSIARAKEKLQRLGFTEAQIAIHTADEPDAGLLALANDESREVLIFKMAVALGFDAPRAFALVSMRAARDADFGVQLVGRILRVHRKLQGRAQAEILRGGYVFLADAESQSGLDAAGQRINQITTEYAKISPATAIVVIAGKPTVQVLGPGGQSAFWPAASPAYPTPGDEKSGPVAEPETSFALNLLLDNYASVPPSQGATALTGGPQGAAIIAKFRYPLRACVPRRFKTQVLPPDFEAVEEDCAKRFIVSADDLIAAIAANVKVQKRTLDVFTRQMEMELVNATLSADQAAVQAQRILMRSRVFHARELRRVLLARLAKILETKGLEGANEPAKLDHFLNIILVTHPQLLLAAQRGALGEYTQLQDADDLPAEIDSLQPLNPSPLGAYGRMPPDLNGWEKSFAEFLDRDHSGTIRWWVRNLPLRPWAVRVLLPDGRGFFPDFLIGVDGRKREDGVLLADPKFLFESADEAPKTLTEHKLYGRVLILSQTGDKRWATVRYDSLREKPVLGPEFSIADAAGF